MKVSPAIRRSVSPYMVLGLAMITAVTSFGDDNHSLDFSRRVTVYAYQPWVFADRKLTVGMPSNAGVLRSHLWYLRMDESTRSSYGMERLGGFLRENKVPGLDLNGHRTFTNGDFETLMRAYSRSQAAAPSKFRLLKLEDTLIDDRSLATVARLFDLRVLSLNDRVSDAGVERLTTLKQLHTLIIPSAQISDRSAAAIAQLSKLERLSVKESRITDNGVRALSSLPLRQIDLGPSVADAGLEALTAMRTLEEINLHASRVSVQGLGRLAVLPKLHTIFLGPSWTDADMPGLVAFKNLKRLDLTGAKITDASLATLAQMTGLEELALTDTAVTGKAMTMLRQLPRLRYLELSGTPLEPEVLKHLDGFSALQVISFSSHQRLAITDIQPLSRLPLLHSIIVNGHPLGRDVVDYLRQLNRMRSFWKGWAEVAYAADVTEAEVSDVLMIATRPGEETSRPMRGIRGLPLIHETEVSLNEVIAAPNMIGQDNQQDTEKNFLGEFTVGGDSKSGQKK